MFRYFPHCLTATPGLYEGFFYCFTGSVFLKEYAFKIGKTEINAVLNSVYGCLICIFPLPDSKRRKAL